MTMDLDPGLDYRHWRKDFASVFPAIHSSFYAYSKRDDVSQAIKEHGFRSFDQFNYLSDEGLFRYDAALYSAGGVSSLDVERSMVNDAPLYRRRKDTTIISDSGGFQVYQGIWTPDEYHGKRAEILAWQEAISDIAIAMDVPTGSVHSDKADCIDSFEECLTWTKLNCDWLIQNRDPRKARMLNVMQGLSVDGPDGALAWYEAIKGYCDRSKWGEQAFDGWAFGGMAVRNRSAILRSIARMLRDGVLGPDSNQRWVHMLGITGPEDVAFFTLLQRALRKVLKDDGFTVSCDASNPNSEMGKRRQYYAEGAQGIKLRKALEMEFFDYHGGDTPDLAQYVRDWVGMHPDALTFDVGWFRENMGLLDWDFDLSRCAEDDEIEIGAEFVQNSPEFLLAAYDRLVEVPDFKAFAVERLNAHPDFTDFILDRVVESAKALGTSALAEHLTTENYWKLVEMRPPKSSAVVATDDDADEEDGTRPDRLTPMGYIVHTCISQEMYLRYTYEGAAAEIEKWPGLADELAEALVSETPDTALAKIVTP